MPKVTEGRTRSGVVRAACTLLALFLATMSAVPACADLVTYDISFSANTFQVGSGGNPPPVDPVTGSVTVTFDPSVEVTNSTANITLNSLNIALGSSISFSYDPDYNGTGSSPGRLAIGGINAGADTIIFSPSTNDFWFFIDNFSTTPTFLQVGYTQTAVSSNNLFFTLDRTGSVSISAVPEPASIALVGGGLGLLTLAVRRRRTKTRA